MLCIRLSSSLVACDPDDYTLSTQHLLTACITVIAAVRRQFLSTSIDQDTLFSWARRTLTNSREKVRRFKGKSKIAIAFEIESESRATWAGWAGLGWADCACTHLHWHMDHRDPSTFLVLCLLLIHPLCLVRPFAPKSELAYTALALSAAAPLVYSQQWSE